MSLISLAGIAGPTLFAGSFGYFVGKSTPVHLPGVPWFIASSLLVLGVLIAWRYARVQNVPTNVVADVA
jgi:DHA1 family tetracycline resistance protein-like MFS transporter